VRWKLTVEYDGADFAGWQLQPNQRTVQGVVEDAAEALFQHTVRAFSSGRTDAGVHAVGQVVAVDTVTDRTPLQVLKGLNAKLPDDVAVTQAVVAPEGFDPRSWSVSKHYRYRMLDDPARHPLRRREVRYLTGPLDAQAMALGAQALMGRHDFSSFRASGCTAMQPVRTVKVLEVARRGDEVHIDVGGNGFLRHMVRIMAGTLEQVGLGRRDPSWVAEVVAARQRRAAGPTAPASGLCLMAVTYGDGPPPWIT